MIMPISKPKMKDLSGFCISCKQKVTVIVEHDHYRKWKYGALVQRVFPYLSADLREFLISQMCGKCYDKLMGGTVGKA